MDVNDFVILPISKRSAGVTFAPALGYSVVPAARSMVSLSPFRLMLREAAEMCSGFARVATYVASVLCREGAMGPSLDWATAGEHRLSGIRTTTAAVDRYMRSPARVAVVVFN